MFSVLTSGDKIVPRLCIAGKPRLSRGLSFLGVFACDISWPTWVRSCFALGQKRLLCRASVKGHHPRFVDAAVLVDPRVACALYCTRGGANCWQGHCDTALHKFHNADTMFC